MDHTFGDLLICGMIFLHRALACSGCFAQHLRTCSTILMCAPYLLQHSVTLSAFAQDLFPKFEHFNVRCASWPVQGTHQPFITLQAECWSCEIARTFSHNCQFWSELCGKAASSLRLQQAKESFIGFALARLLNQS